MVVTATAGRRRGQLEKQRKSLCIPDCMPGAMRLRDGATACAEGGRSLGVELPQRVGEAIERRSQCAVAVARKHITAAGHSVTRPGGVGEAGAIPLVRSASAAWRAPPPDRPPPHAAAHPVWWHRASPIVSAAQCRQPPPPRCRLTSPR